MRPEPRPPLYHPRGEKLTPEDFNRVMALMSDEEQAVLRRQVRLLAAHIPYLSEAGAQELLLSIAAYWAAAARGAP